MVAPLIVVQVVAGSNPVSHPILFQRQNFACRGPVFFFGGEGEGGPYLNSFDAEDELTYTVQGLENGVPYYFVVSAYNNTTHLEGPDSNELSATPDIATQTEPPTAYIEDVIYNDLGQVTQIEYGNGAVSLYEYDPDNFRLKRIYTTDSAQAVIQDLNYTYDAVGNIVSIVNKVDTQNHKTQLFEYDHLDRLKKATNDDPESYGTKDYKYDEFGNITEKDGKTYVYSRFNAGPHAVTSTDDGITYTEYQYDDNGNMTHKIRDGVTTEYIYDVENRLEKVKKDDQTLAEYFYDGDGARVKRIDYTQGTVNNTCFLAGTLVHMADGSLKPIEEIEVGDEVLSFNEKNGEKVSASVTQAFNTEYVDEYVLLNSSLGVTGNHLFYSQGEWRKVSRLSVDDKLLGLGLTDRDIVSIEKIQAPEQVRVYNIEVDQYHNYFVGTEGYLRIINYPLVGSMATVVREGYSPMVCRRYMLVLCMRRATVTPSSMCSWVPPGS